MTALVMVGCGSAESAKQNLVTSTAAIPQAHPQSVAPVAGDPGTTTTQATRPAGIAQPLHDPRPTAPATDTRAPSKGAPTDAEVRAAIARFQLAVARYRLDRLDFSHALLDRRLNVAHRNEDGSNLGLAVGPEEQVFRRPHIIDVEVGRQFAVRRLPVGADPQAAIALTWLMC